MVSVELNQYLTWGLLPPVLFLLSRPYNGVCGAWVGRGEWLIVDASLSCLDHVMECGCDGVCCPWL